MRKQIFMVGALLALVTVLFVFADVPTASASHPPTPQYMAIRIENLPENAVFADILIRIDERDPNFTAVNVDNLALFGLDVSAEIVGFNDNGFMSFTFHYIDASAEIYFSESRRFFWAQAVRFGFGEKEGFRTQFHNLLENYPNMKIALLDYYGNVLSVSSEFSLPSPRRGVWISGSWGGEVVCYNHETGEVTVWMEEVRYNYLGSILRPLISDSPILSLGVMVLFIIILEIVVGLCFGFRRKTLMPILPANLVVLAFIGASLLWLLLGPFYSNLGISVFFLIVILFIAITYIVKFFIYRKASVMKDISTRKILLYTITANTLSLVFLAGSSLVIFSL